MFSILNNFVCVLVLKANLRLFYLFLGIRIAFKVTFHQYNYQTFSAYCNGNFIKQFNINKMFVSMELGGQNEYSVSHKQQLMLGPTRHLPPPPPPS